MTERVNGIGVALQNKCRSFCVLQMQEWRAIEKSGRLFVGDAPEPLVVRRMLLGAVFGNKIGHASAGNRGFKARSLRDGPFAHVTAVGPAADPKTVWIGDLFRNQIINSGLNIFEVF